MPSGSSHFKCNQRLSFLSAFSKESIYVTLLNGRAGRDHRAVQAGLGVVVGRRVGLWGGVGGGANEPAEVVAEEGVSHSYI